MLNVLRQKIPWAYGQEEIYLKFSQAKGHIKDSLVNIYLFFFFLFLVNLTFMDIFIKAKTYYVEKAVTGFLCIIVFLLPRIILRSEIFWTKESLMNVNQ